MINNEINNNIISKIGNNIRYYRQKKDLSLKEFGKLMNLSLTTIQKYETGKIEPSITTLYEISNVLNVDLAKLLDIDVKINISVSESEIKTELRDIKKQLSLLLNNFDIKIPTIKDSASLIFELNNILSIVDCKIVKINNKNYLKTTDKEFEINEDDVTSLLNSITSYIKFTISSFENKK